MSRFSGPTPEHPDPAAIAASDIAECVRIIERYHDQEIGVADASIVMLAARYATRTILTLDRRLFDVLRPLDGGRLKLLPTELRNGTDRQSRRGQARFAPPCRAYQAQALNPATRQMSI